MSEANVSTGIAMAIAIFLSISQASTTEIPSKYRGIWTWSDSCEQTIATWLKEPGEFPFMVVTRDETIHHESSCKIASIKHVADKDTLNFRCYGEGEEWELSQDWSIRHQTMDIDGGMLFDRMIIKVPTLVVSDPEGDFIWRKCGAICVEGKCWGEQ